MRNFMRNINKWVLALLFTTFVAGCGSSSNNSAPSPVTPALSDAKAISSYALDGTNGTINELTKTIAVTMPYNTDVTALVATFITTGEFVDVVSGIDAFTQESGVTANDFTGPVVYQVTAVDSSSTTYEVNVTVAAINDAVMTSYSLDGVVGIISENTTPKTIAVLMPFGTDLLLPLTATFAATGDVTIGMDVQESGVTTNIFTMSPPASAIYTVTAADGTTTADYEVNVTVALIDANPLAPELGEAGRFVILASAAITTTGVTAISNGDIAVEDEARSAMAGFTVVGSEGAFAELINGLSYGIDDANPSPFPYPLKTATNVIGDPWATTGAMITQAKTDLGIANSFLATDPNPNSPTQVCPIQLGGLTFYRGVYKTAENVQITTGDLTLDAEGDPNSVFIFTIDGTLTTGAPGGNIVLINGALAKNVYFRTGGFTVIAANTFFKGNIFAWSKVEVLSEANIEGRLFALTDRVTLIADTVTKP